VNAEDAKKRSEQVVEFLESILQLADQPPDPAWLRQVSPPARTRWLGWARSDEILDAHMVSAATALLERTSSLS
jgi:hypothetical protein